MMERYSRQILFAPVGAAGQERLLNSKITIVGMGALGTVLANHMVRAGTGTVRLIDRDYVEWSNLQRQMLYDESDAQQMLPKAEAAAVRLRAVNSGVAIESVIADLHAGNAEEVIGKPDLILDGTDNFSVRFLINDYAVKHQIPWIYGGAVSSRGVSQTILPGVTPCLRCLFGAPPDSGNAETCDTAGVLGPIIHQVASRQAVEAIKYLTGNREAMDLRMWQTDCWYNQNSWIDTAKARRPDCTCCGSGNRSFDFLDTDASASGTQTLCGRDSVQVQPARPSNLSFEEFRQRWEPLGTVEQNPFLMRLHLKEGPTLVLFRDGRLLVQGTQDASYARALYSRYIGD